MLKSLHLVNFRAFRDFTVSFGEGAYLVGPNNAGKSTLLTALRTADVLLRYAYRRKPDIHTTDRDVSVTGYPVILRDFPALQDSLRYEFGSDETRITLQWKSGASLDVVWPDENNSGGEGFFYLTQPSGYPAMTPVQARNHFPQLGVIPIIGPTEHTERLLAPDYVSQSVSSRLASRHFRNQLRILNAAGELDAFMLWASPWMGDLRFDALGQHMSEDGMILEAFFFEGNSRIPKEIVWAGDGVQVWLQLLFHIYRVRENDSIILDEPEVYLHPDLQRRLVGLLESTGRQVVVATHSAEMVAESDGRLTTLVDRTRRHANRPKSDSDYEMLSSTLGTAFNLRLARALRSKVAVFVEGKDMTLLRRFAKTAGLTHLEREVAVTVIPLQGYSNWGQVEPFRWLCQELLPEAIKTFVILDRDYRSEAVGEAVVQKFADSEIVAHVWSRKELESYLLNDSVISRLAKAPEELVHAWLDEITLEMENDVFSRMLDERIRELVNAKKHAVEIMAEFKPVFETAWAESHYRRIVCPPKQIVSKLNDRLQASGYKAVSMSGLVRAHRKTEIPKEVVDVLSAIEAHLTP